MPNIQVADYLKQEIGINPNHFDRTENTEALIQAATRLGHDLSGVLYNAIVKLDGNVVLHGPPLSAQQLHVLKEVAKIATKQTNCPKKSRQIIQDFGGAALRYADFLTNDFGSSIRVSNVINKQVREAKTWGTNATPKHTLNRHGNEVYELLTWMTPSEIKRLEDQYPKTDGLFSMDLERSRNRKWGNNEFAEYKVTLGSGGFGSARIARRVRDDQYMVLKKVHPQDVGPQPAPIAILRGVNDGSSSGISRVYDSFIANSSRRGGNFHVEASSYTLSEIGIIDTEKFIDIFSVMSYALNPEYARQGLAKSLRASMLGSTDDIDDTLSQLSSAARLGTNPCNNPERVRQFRNTFAYQMLEAVHQMHQRGRAHNDIKPNNFVLAYDSKNLLRVKLIDFDMNASVKETIGIPRDVYATAFSAPQVSSNGANNQADLNDAYSMGCTLRLLNGEPLEALILQRMLVKGEIRDQKNKKIKPVEDRRLIETRFIHLPELSTLQDIIGLLSHPHCGKRYTIAQAMQSPLFTQTNNMLSATQFSAMAEKIIRQGYLIPQARIQQLEVLQQCKRALAQQEDEDKDEIFGPMATALSQQDHKLLTKRYIQNHGEQKLNHQLQKVEVQIAKDNRNAVLRRGLRQLNINHHLKSAAAREASYVYKSPKK